MAEGLGPFTGYGFRIYLDSVELNQEAAQLATINNYKATNGGKARPQPKVSELIVGGWGLLLQETLKAKGTPNAMNDVLGIDAYNQGPTSDGGNYWLVPVSQFYDGAKVKTLPRYRGVRVYRDSASAAAAAAQQQIDQQSSQADTYQKQIELYEQMAGQGDAKLKLAIAKGRSGQGQRTMELTVISPTLLFVATSAFQSADAEGPHPGESIADPGDWEEVTGNADPSSMGLPAALLTKDPKSGQVRPAIQEYMDVLRVARSGRGSGGILGQLGIGGTSGVYPQDQVDMAQAALQALGLTF